MSLPDSPDDAAAPSPAPRHLHPVSVVAAGTETEQTGHTEPMKPGEGMSRWRWLADAARPDSGLYTARAASPHEVMARARYGTQLADAGPLRILARAYGYYQVAGKTATRTLEWLLFDHPARTVAALLLAVFTWLLFFA